MTMKNKKITFTHLYIYIFIYMQFKQLDLKPQGTWVTRTVNAPRFKTTLTAILVGAVIGFLFFYFTSGGITGHVQSLILASIFSIISFLLFVS